MQSMVLDLSVCLPRTIGSRKQRCFKVVRGVSPFGMRGIDLAGANLGYSHPVKWACARGAVLVTLFAGRLDGFHFQGFPAMASAAPGTPWQRSVTASHPPRLEDDHVSISARSQSLHRPWPMSMTGRGMSG